MQFWDQSDPKINHTALFFSHRDDKVHGLCEKVVMMWSFPIFYPLSPRPRPAALAAGERAKRGSRLFYDV